MKKLLTRAVSSLGVVAVVGLGGATMASAAPVASPSAVAQPCTYPFTQCLTADTPGQPADTPDQPADSAALDSPAATPLTQSSPGDALPATVSDSTPLAQTTGSLAFTGADIWQTAAVAGVLIGGGGVLVRVSRRRRTA